MKNFSYLLAIPLILLTAVFCFYSYSINCHLRNMDDRLEVLEERSHSSIRTVLVNDEQDVNISDPFLIRPERTP